MGTITIKSDRVEDLYFINEMAKRMGLVAEITSEDNQVSNRIMKQDRKKVTAISIAESIKQGLKEVEEIKAGKLKPLTLTDLLHD